ncbi:MAG: flippase [Candidatus Rifleibacteriota bacterium]
MPLTRTARVGFNTISNILRFAIALLVVIMLTPLIIKTLGKEEFGLWSLTLSVLGFLGLLDFGFGTGLVKYVAECRATGEKEKLNEILSSLWATYLALSIISFLVVALISVFFHQIFEIATPLHEKATIVLWLLALRTSILSLPFSLFRGILFGQQLIWQINLIQSFSSIFYGLTAWFLLANDHGIVQLASANLASMLLEGTAYVILVYSQNPDIKIKLRLANRESFRELASFSFFTFIVSVSSLILLKTDPIIVQLFESLNAVAIYAIALKIVENAHLFSKQFINAISPLISELKAQQDEEKLRFALINCARFALVPSLLLSLPIIAFAADILRFWLGVGFEGAVLPLNILLIAMLAAIPQMLASMILTMSGHQKTTAKAAIFSALVNIAASLFLVRHYGIAGVAGGTLIATIITDVFVIPAIAGGHFGIGWLSYWSRIILPLAPAITLNLGLCLTINHYFPASSLSDIAAKSIPGLIVFMVYWWSVSLEPSEKELFRKRLLKFKKD